MKAYLVFNNDREFVKGFKSLEAAKAFCDLKYPGRVWEYHPHAYTSGDDLCENNIRPNDLTYETGPWGGYDIRVTTLE